MIVQVNVTLSPFHWKRFKVMNNRRDSLMILVIQLHVLKQRGLFKAWSSEATCESTLMYTYTHLDFIPTLSQYYTTDHFCIGFATVTWKRKYELLLTIKTWIPSSPRSERFINLHGVKLWLDKLQISPDSMSITLYVRIVISYFILVTDSLQTTGSQTFSGHRPLCKT